MFCKLCAWYLRRPKEGVGSPATEVRDLCELPCRCWEPNLDPLQKQYALLIQNLFSTPNSKALTWEMKSKYEGK